MNLDTTNKQMSISDAAKEAVASHVAAQEAGERLHAARRMHGQKLAMLQQLCAEQSHIVAFVNGEPWVIEFDEDSVYFNKAVVA